MNSHTENSMTSVPCNKGRLVGQKAPLKLKEIWAIRIRLQLPEKARDLALFNLAIDSKLRGCDLVSLRVLDVAQRIGPRQADRWAILMPVKWPGAFTASSSAYGTSCSISARN